MSTDSAKQEVIASFNRIAAFPDRPDLNGRYAGLILKQVPRDCRNALDIGCGTGELALRLAGLCDHVVGIDIAPVMIEEAQRRHAAPNVSYVVADFDDFQSRVRLDFIVSVAAFHHLDLDRALPKCRSFLSEEGVLAVLDLRHSRSPLDLALGALALPAHRFLLARNWGDASPEEMDAWRSHFKMDKFLSYGALRRAYQKHFENVMMKKLFFWRYLAVCR